jgi:hypothetical protein
MNIIQKDDNLRELSHMVARLTEEITEVLAPIFEEMKDEPKAIQLAMGLAHMRVIQATTMEEDWVPAAQMSASMLVEAMKRKFTS